MWKEQLRNGAVLLALTAVILIAVSPSKRDAEPQKQENAEYKDHIDDFPVAQLIGEGRSPDGRYLLCTAGVTDRYISGLRIPETLELVDINSNEIRWADQGWLCQYAAWSPDSRFVGVGYGGRTWNQIRFIDTNTFDTWDLSFPDGSQIPEYLFLPDDWAAWCSEDTVHLKIGRTEEEQRLFYCVLGRNHGELTGNLVEQAFVPLEGTYDFNHNGVEETLLLEGNVPVHERNDLPTLFGEATSYVLHIQENGEDIWADYAATSHAGWNSIFACRMDGKDYLLRYDPAMCTGNACFFYDLFSLDSNGNEVLFRTNAVEFDVNFRSTLLHSFDAKEIAEFLEEVHAYLDESTLLLSTDGGVFHTERSGADFEEDAFLGEHLYDGNGTVLEKLLAFQHAAEENQMQ